MKKRHQRDLIKDHHEWIEHMYNPGYWVNKVTIFHLTAWREARKRNKLNGLFGMLIFGLGIAAFVIPATEEGRSRGVSFLAILVEDMTVFVPILFSLVFLAFLYLFLQGPAKDHD